MKNFKGGYLLISLGMVALASITALPSGTVEKIKASSKRIVLTDISLDGVKQENDITVQPIISGTSVIIKGVYGKDITIASDDSVTVADENTGMKLYKHVISVGVTFSDNSTGTLALEIVTTSNEKSTSYTGAPPRLNKMLEKNVVSFVGIWSFTSKWGYLFVGNYNGYVTFTIKDSSNQSVQISSFVSDTVYNIE